MSIIEHKVAEILEPVIEGQGFELVRIRISGDKRRTLQIMAERADGTMSAEDCANLSRAISEILDVTDPIDGMYNLEVSSPGIDRPLTRLKDFDRWQGFEARLELTEMVEGRKRLKGIVAGSEDGNVLFDIEGEDETAVIPFGMLAGAKLILTDELVRESLRAAKEAVKAAALNSEEELSNTDADAALAPSTKS